VHTSKQTRSGSVLESTERGPCRGINDTQRPQSLVQQEAKVRDEMTSGPSVKYGGEIQYCCTN
jgi:hypothetical protein